MPMTCKPVGWTVLAEEVKRKNNSSLIIPDAVTGGLFLKHIVLAVGEPRITADGREVPIPVKVGDDIRFNTDVGPRYFTRLDPALFGGRELMLIDCECIKGVFSGEPEPSVPSIVNVNARPVLVH